MPKRSPIEYAAAIVLVILAMAGVFWFFSYSAVRETRSIASAATEAIFRQLNIRPLVTVDRTVIFQEHTPVLELVTHRQKVRHIKRWSHSFLGSTKEIVLEGDFAVSTGFDLKERFSVSYDTRSRTIHVIHPAPKVLAVELGKIAVADEHGWLNRVSDEDRSAALNEFTVETRRAAETDAALLKKTREDLRGQIRELFERDGFTLEFQELGSEPVHIPSLP